MCASEQQKNMHAL